MYHTDMLTLCCYNIYDMQAYNKVSLSTITAGTVGKLACIGIRYPTFWTDGTVHHFSGRKSEEFAVNRGDLQRLNYNKIVFGRGSDPDPVGRAHDALPDPRVGWQGYTSSYTPLLLSSDPRAPCCPSELVPHFLDKSLLA